MAPPPAQPSTLVPCLALPSLPSPAPPPSSPSALAASLGLPPISTGQPLNHTRTIVVASSALGGAAPLRTVLASGARHAVLLIRGASDLSAAQRGELWGAAQALAREHIAAVHVALLGRGQEGGEALQMVLQQVSSGLPPLQGVFTGGFVDSVKFGIGQFLFGTHTSTNSFCAQCCSNVGCRLSDFVEASSCNYSCQQDIKCCALIPALSSPPSDSDLSAVYRVLCRSWASCLTSPCPCSSPFGRQPHTAASCTGCTGCAACISWAGGAATHG